jgi:nodulation protein E
MQLMRAGIYDRVIVGGSESLITPATMRCWEMMRVLFPEKCQPSENAQWHGDR